jgi:hypothetical protein
MMILQPERMSRGIFSFESNMEYIFTKYVVFDHVNANINHISRKTKNSPFHLILL